MTTEHRDIVVREYSRADEAEVVALLAESLAWPDEIAVPFFRWKHEDNPFGTSPAWVAEVDGELAGFRAFMRWRFIAGDAAYRAVRAVDTVTSPHHRGGGVFRTLTEHGLDVLRAEGVDFIFNTPNDQSRPGYLKMGWREIGRVPVHARPRNLLAVPKVLRSRVAAELWSADSAVGVPAAEALADSDAVTALLAARARPPGAHSDHDAASLRWRYGGFTPASYRALYDGSSVTSGVVLFRLRRRGGALECTVGDVLVPSGDDRAAARLVRRALRETGADYAIGAGSARWRGFVTSRRSGPVLTWRAVDASEPPASWGLVLGDVELF